MTHSRTTGFLINTLLLAGCVRASNAFQPFFPRWTLGEATFLTAPSDGDRKRRNYLAIE